MKNTLLVIALAVIFGFSMISCDGNGFSGAGTLNLSGKVYYAETNPERTIVTFKTYNGNNLTIYDHIGGDGKIENGNFTYSIGIPTSASLINFEDKFYRYDDVASSADDVSAYEISYFSIAESNKFDLRKENLVLNYGNGNISQVGENVTYLYVNKDATVTGKERTVGPVTELEDGVLYTETRIYKNFRLELKQGWNSIYKKTDISGTYTGTLAAPITMTITRTETISLKNPSLKWVLGGYVATPPLPPASSTTLIEDSETDGNLPNRSDVNWYNFNVTLGETYYIYLNDSDEGDGTKTGEVGYSAWYSDGKNIFSRDYGYYYPKYFTAEKTGVVYLRVTPEWHTGTYSIMYTTTPPSSSSIMGALETSPKGLK